MEFIRTVTLVRTVIWFSLISQNVLLLSQNGQQAHYSNYSTTCSVTDSAGGIIYTIFAEGQTYGQQDYIMIPFNSIAKINPPSVEIQRPNGKWKDHKKVIYKDVKIETEHFSN